MSRCRLFFLLQPSLTVTLRRCQIRGVSSNCLLFPGQGSQRVGMGKDLITAANSGAIPELFQVAEQVLGYDLRPLLLRGPQVRLDETVHCQPAVVVASLMALEAANPEVGVANLYTMYRYYSSFCTVQVLPNCKAAAGFSVGEITAMIAAESLSLEQGKEAGYAAVISLVYRLLCLLLHVCLERGKPPTIWAWCRFHNGASIKSC